MVQYRFSRNDYQIVDAGLRYWAIEDMSTTTNVLHLHKDTRISYERRDPLELYIYYSGQEIIIEDYPSEASRNIDIAFLETLVTLVQANETNQLQQINIASDTLTSLGNPTDAAVTDPIIDTSLIGYTKGILTQTNAVKEVLENGVVDVNVTNSPLTVYVDPLSGLATEPKQDIQITNFGAQGDLVASSDTGNFSLMAFVKRKLQHLSTIISRIPTSLTGGGNFRVAVQEALPAGSNNIGSVDIANTPLPVSGTVTISSPIPLATEARQVQQITNFGEQTDAAAVTDTGNFSLIALFKRLLQGISDLRVRATNTEAHTNAIRVGIGTNIDSIATSDTDNVGLNPLFRYYLTRFTTFLSRIPASLTGGGNFRVAVQEALPAGSNNIGSVNIANTPLPITGSISAVSAPSNVAPKVQQVVNVGATLPGQAVNFIGTPSIIMLQNQGTTAVFCTFNSAQVDIGAPAGNSFRILAGETVVLDGNWVPAQTPITTKLRTNAGTTQVYIFVA